MLITNSCETLRSNLNLMFYNVHPNIFKLIDSKKVTNLYSYKITKHSQNRITPSIKKKTIYLRLTMTDFQLNQKKIEDSNS